MASDLLGEQLVFRPSALAYGMSDAQLKAAGKSRQLTKVGPGVYLPGNHGLTFPEDWHREIALAIASEQAYAVTRSPTSERPVLSFQTAAAVHRLALLTADFTYVNFTRRISRSGSIRYIRHTHPGHSTTARSPKSRA